jgi:hypothetical protein
MSYLGRPAEDSKRKAGRQPVASVKKPYLSDVINLCGGTTALARYLGVKHNTVSGWLYTSLQVSTRHAKAISELTLGLIKAKEINLERRGTSKTTDEI